MSATDHLHKAGQPVFTSWMRGDPNFELYTLICRTKTPLPWDAGMPSLTWKLDGAINKHPIETLERLCRAEVDDGHGIKSYCNSVYADRGGLMTHIRNEHPYIKPHTREKKGAHDHLGKNKGGKTSKSDQPIIKGYYRKLIEDIRSVEPNYFRDMEPLRYTMHEDLVTYRAMVAGGQLPSQMTATPSQPHASAPQADVDIEEVQAPTRNGRSANTSKKRTADKAPVKMKSKSKRTWEDTGNGDDHDEESFKREVDDHTEQIVEETVIKTEEDIKDLWAKFSHPENPSHVLVESRPINVIEEDSVFQEVKHCPLIPLRRRRSSDTFDERHKFSDGKSAVDLVPKRRAMLAITDVMNLEYGAAKACDVCEKSTKKGGKRVKVSRCKMNSAKCRGFKQFSNMTFNVKFLEAEYVKYHQQTLAEARKRA